jgi:hypothetical protein
MGFKIIKADGRVIYIPLCRDACQQNKKQKQPRRFKRQADSLGLKRKCRIRVYPAE